MTTFTLRGNQIGEALQFQENGNNITVEIGRVWFSATDTFTIVAGPGAVDPVIGAFVGGAGHDLFDGGTRRDILTGGAGGDTFVFGAGDRVTDFSAAQGDMVRREEAAQ